MKQQQFYITLGLSILALVLCVSVIVLNSSNQSLQRANKEKLLAEEQKRFQDLQGRQISLQNTATSIVKDMGESALKNDKMKELLRKQGIEVRPNATPASTPAPPAGESEHKPAETPAESSPAPAKSNP